MNIYWCQLGFPQEMGQRLLGRDYPRLSEGLRRFLGSIGGMSEVPDRVNFYSTLHTKLSPWWIAKIYKALGWKVRKCAWYDYEASCPWAELVIEAASPVLMNGAVADILTNAEELLAPLRAANITFLAEGYGPDRQLLREWCNDER